MSALTSAKQPLTRAQRAQRRATQNNAAPPGRLAIFSLANVDLQLIAIIGTFLMLGLFMVFSASAPVAGSIIFVRQLRWAVIGLVAMFVVAALPFRWWRNLSMPLMLVTIAGLVAVLVISNGQFGANRTLLNGRFQPSEFAKLAIALYLAAWASVKSHRLDRFEEGLAPFLLIMAIVAGLIALERSFSVTLIVLVIGFSIFFVAGGNLWQVFIMLLGIAPVLALLMWRAGYPYRRIQAWLTVLTNPAAASPDHLRVFDILRGSSGIGVDPTIWHAKAAVPGLWSDYLFANIGADLHFPGTMLVVGLYAWFAYRCLVIILSSKEPFAKFTAVGLMTWVLTQATIHIGASLALIPTTGQPLPFMSYGGSALVSCMIAAGLLLSISRDIREKRGLNASFAFGRWDWRTRVPRPGRGRGAADDGRGVPRRARTAAGGRRRDVRPAQPHARDRARR